METSLHRTLKGRYGPEAGGRLEVSFGPYRIDAVTADGELVEVQSAALGPLRPKLARLLTRSRVRVVKPVVVARRIVRRASPSGPDLSARYSPKKGSLLDLFDDLVALARLFPHPNLVIDAVAVEVDEVRLRRRRRPGYLVADRALRRVVGVASLATADDLWALLPGGWDAPFTTVELAGRTGRALPFAQRVAYCLRHAGAAEVVAKRGNRVVYRKTAPGMARAPFNPSGA